MAARELAAPDATQNRMETKSKQGVMERSGAMHSREYTGRLATLLEQLDHDAVDRVAQVFLDARQRDARIIFIGNGGSASTASHMAIDIGIGTRGGDRPFRAISLTDNTAVLTGLANDNGYDQVFVRQLKVIMEPGDVVVAISASGNSPNILEAVAHAKAVGNETVGLTGFDGGRLRTLCSTFIHVATDKGEYGLVEDMHLVINHILTSYLTQRIRSA